MASRRWFDPKFLEAKSEEIRLYTKDENSLTLNGGIVLNSDNIENYVPKFTGSYATGTGTVQISQTPSTPTVLSFLDFNQDLSSVGIGKVNSSTFYIRKKGLYWFRVQARVNAPSTVTFDIIFGTTSIQQETACNVLEIAPNQDGFLCGSFFFEKESTTNAPDYDPIEIRAYGTQNVGGLAPTFVSYFLTLQYIG